MNYIDIIISIFVLLFAYKGLKRGLIKALSLFYLWCLGSICNQLLLFIRRLPYQIHLSNMMNLFPSFHSQWFFNSVFIFKNSGFFLLINLVKSLQLSFLDKLFRFVVWSF